MGALVGILGQAVMGSLGSDLSKDLGGGNSWGQNGLNLLQGLYPESKPQQPEQVAQVNPIALPQTYSLDTQPFNFDQKAPTPTSPFSFLKG